MTWLAARLAAVLCLAPAAQAAEHPRLLFDATNLPALRAKARDGLGAQVVAAYRARADRRFLSLDSATYALDGPAAARFLATQVIDLAFLTHLTGERRYVDQAIALLCAVASRAAPQTFDRLNSALAVGNAAHAFALGYDLAAPFLTPAQNQLLRGQVEALGTWLFTSSTTGRHPDTGQPVNWGEATPGRLASNWNAVIHGNLGLCALVLGGHEDWLHRATERLRGFLHGSQDATGAPLEGVSYLGYGKQNAFPFLVALRRSGGPDLLAEAPHVARVTDYLLQTLVPGRGEVVSVNQASARPDMFDWYLHLVDRQRDAAGWWWWLRMFGDPAGHGGDGTWGAAGHPAFCHLLPYTLLWLPDDLAPQPPAAAPQPLAARFDRGLVCARTGWEDDAALVTFTCPPGLTGVWNHADAGSFTFHADGEAFAVDLGAGAGASGQHSVWLVDGRGQDSTGGPTATGGRLTAFEDRGRWVYARGEAARAYRQSGLTGADRQLLFGRGPTPYLVIADDLRHDGPARSFAWRLISGAGNRLTVGPEPGRATILGARQAATCRLSLLQPAGAAWAVAQVPGRPDQPALDATARAANPRFVVLLTAAAPGQPHPTAQFGQQPDASLQVTLAFATGQRQTLIVSSDAIHATAE